MLAEVRLTITAQGATLTLTKSDGSTSDEEAWRLERKVGASEAMEFAKAFFDDAYDAMNFLAHGNDG
jgi:hypothetical protein